MGGCGGTVSAEVSADTVEITATDTTTGNPCPPTLTTFAELINPRDIAGPDLVFAPQVTVNYSHYGELFDSQVVHFNLADNVPVRVHTGSWVTGIPNLALFVDRQGDVMTAAVLDNAADGGAVWYYAVGTINGDVFAADLVLYGENDCGARNRDTRASPVRQGRINMLLQETQILADYEGVLEGQSAPDGICRYQRLGFALSSGMRAPFSYCCRNLPDLAGAWVGGLQGDQTRPDDYRTLTIAFAGLDPTDPMQRTHLFNAYPGTGPQAVADPGDPPNAFACDDLDTQTGPRCRVVSQSLDQQSCAVEFRNQDVGVDRLRTSDECFGLATQPEYVLFRLDD